MDIWDKTYNDKGQLVAFSHTVPTFDFVENHTMTQIQGK